MRKMICLLMFCVGASSASSSSPNTSRFAKYKPIEAYQVIPGVIAMPRYSEDGSVCEIGVQRQLYSARVDRLNAGLSDNEIDQVVVSLVSDTDRVPAAAERSNRHRMIVNGNSYSEVIAEYKNISVIASGYFTAAPKQRFATENNVVVTITWTDRKCQNTVPQ